MLVKLSWGSPMVVWLRMGVAPQLSCSCYERALCSYLDLSSKSEWYKRGAIGGSEYPSTQPLNFSQLSSVFGWSVIHTHTFSLFLPTLFTHLFYNFFTMLAIVYALVFSSALVAAAPSRLAPQSLHRREYNDGKATFYNVEDAGQNEGYSGAVACSNDHYSDSQEFVALGDVDFAGGDSCNKQIWIYDSATGNTVNAPVVDSCTGCEPGHIDISPALWDKLHNGNQGDGEIKVNWGFA